MRAGSLRLLIGEMSDDRCPIERPTQAIDGRPAHADDGCLQFVELGVIAPDKCLSKTLLIDQPKRPVM